MSNSPKTPT